MTRQANTRPFEPGDRVIVDGQYIGYLIESQPGRRGKRWRIQWEDGAPTTSPTFPEESIVYANGGPQSAKRIEVAEAWMELSHAAMDVGAAAARFQNARDKYIGLDPYGKKHTHD